MGFMRKFGTEQTLVIINYGATGANVKVGNLPANRAMEAKFPSSAARLNIDAAGTAQVSVSPQSVQVFSVKQ